MNDIGEADRLYDLGKTEDLYAFLRKYLESNPRDGAALWRYARACHDLSLLVSRTFLPLPLHLETLSTFHSFHFLFLFPFPKKKDKEEKKKLIYEAYDMAKKSIEYAPSDFAAHKWAGITLSTVGDYEGSKVQIANAFIIREHFDQAIALNSKDPTSRHLLGLWCFTFADMPWYMAKIAAALFATPPTSSYQESLDHFVAGSIQIKY